MSTAISSNPQLFKNFSTLFGNTMSIPVEKQTDILSYPEA